MKIKSLQPKLEAYILPRTWCRKLEGGGEDQSGNIVNSGRSQAGGLLPTACC